MVTDMCVLLFTKKKNTIHTQKPLFTFQQKVNNSY